MNLNKHIDFFNPEKFIENIHIIGCGSVGAIIAENLARLGIKKMYLYDFDTVSEHNITNQLFLQKHIGKSKLKCLKEMLLQINPDIELILNNDGWNESSNLDDHVFICVDSINLRRKIIENNKYNLNIIAFYDIRTRLLEGQHFAASMNNDKSLEILLGTMNFTDEEADNATPISACGTTLSVAYTIRAIVALVIANFINKVLHDELYRYIILNLENKFELTTFRE